MCEFFSCIATADGRLLFTEDDSHSEIILRAQLQDTELYARRFVRLECVEPHDRVRVDEDGTLPGWFEEDLLAIEERVLLLTQRVVELANKRRKTILNAHKAYDKVYEPAIAEYERAEHAALEIWREQVLPFETALEADIAILEAERDAALTASNTEHHQAMEAVRAQYSTGDNPDSFESTHAFWVKRAQARQAAWDVFGEKSSEIYRAYDEATEPFTTARDAAIQAAQDACDALTVPANEKLGRTRARAWNRYYSALAKIEGFLPA